MSEVYKLGISVNNNKPINEVSSINVLANKGVVGDRHFKEFNDPYNQLTLIESENIDYYNIKYSLNIPYVDFRRNIISKGIKLNQLIGKEIIIGKVRIFGHRLCDPCKYLQNKLKHKYKITNLFNLYKRGGLRCEILSNGRITVNDEIKVSQ